MKSRSSPTLRLAQGAALGYVLRFNRWLVPIPAILANTVIVPLVLRHGYGVDMPLYLMAIYVAAGEIIGCYILGELFATILLRYKGRIFGSGIFAFAQLLQGRVGIPQLCIDIGQ